MATDWIDPPKPDHSGDTENLMDYFEVNPDDFGPSIVDPNREVLVASAITQVENNGGIDSTLTLVSSSDGLVDDAGGAVDVGSFIGDSTAPRSIAGSGYDVGIQKVEIDHAASNFTAIGQSLGATPGAQGEPNGVIMQAYATLVTDTLEGTVSPTNLAMFAASPWHQLQFIGQNTMQVTERDGSSWDFNAPTKFPVPTASGFAFAKVPEQIADWDNVINAAITLGPVLAGSHATVVGAFTLAAEMEPAGSAAQVSFAKLATDIDYGSSRTGNFDVFPSNHWGSTPY